MKKPTCETCVYFENTTKVAGLCRRNAPRHLIAVYPNDDTLEETSDFTGVNTQEWCGEHQDFQKWIDSREIDEKGITILPTSTKW